MNWIKRSRVLWVAAVALCLAAPLAAQQVTYTITGRVLDAETGNPLTGVQVLVRGTRFGGLSDSRGAYTVLGQLTPGSYTIEAQMIGRELQTQPLTLGSERLVTAPEMRLRTTALSMDEIVVTGTAAPTARRALGNAVSTVEGRSLNEAPAITIDQAIQGKVAGAVITSNTGTPGGGVSVRLRGTSSIVSGSEPLYIVDGVIIDNNGDQQVNFGYRSNPSNRLADLDPDDIERMEILKGAAAAALYGSRANNGVVQIFTKRGRAGITQVTASTRFTYSELERQIPFALTPVNEAGATVARFDPQDLIFRTPWSNDTYVALSGGSPETRYYISSNWVDQKGIMEGSEHQKLNVRMNLDQRLNSWVDLAVGANFVKAHSDLIINGENGTGGLLTAIVFTPTTLDLAARNPQTGELVNKLSGTFPNPLDVLANWTTPQDIYRFVGSAQLKASPINALRLEYRLGFDRYEMETAQSIPRGDATFPLGSAFSANRRNMLINNDLSASYEFNAGSSLRLSTGAGLNHTYQRVDQLNLGGSDLAPTTLLVRGAIPTATEAQIEALTLGFYGQQQLAWKERFYLTGAARWDASSTFGEAERWQLYPKVSASWVISEESFWRDVVPSFLTEFRLRGALGYAGNQPPLDNAYSRVPRYVTSVNISRLGLVPSPQVGNPDLKPERQREWEAGFEASVWNKRIGANFTYYDKYVKDLLLERPFVPSAGYATILDNVGEMSNRGVEVELSSVNLQGSRFGWNSRLIFSKNKNRVEKLTVAPFIAGYTSRVEQGQPISAHFMLSFQRDANGQIVTDSIGPVRTAVAVLVPDHEEDGVMIAKSPWPDFTASLGNDFRFGRNLELSLLLDGQFGHYLWNQTRRIQDLFAAGPLYDQLLKKEITAAQRTRLQGIWENYLEDASYVKLRDVSLRWSTSSPKLRTIGASRMQIEVLGRNLYTWTDYSGYDPEINMFGLSTVARGTDFAVYPNPRTVGLGVRLTY
jgi:TonB-dependent SusC/RagA subfamily outer membrane receptor